MNQKCNCIRIGAKVVGRCAECKAKAERRRLNQRAARRRKREQFVTIRKEV